MNAAKEYRTRAEECLAAALASQDGANRSDAIDRALYWFKQAEETEGTGRAEQDLPPPAH